MGSRINETLLQFLPYPLCIQIGTGTSGTAVTYDFPFSATPTLTVTGTTDASHVLNATTESATAHTITSPAAGAVAYNYMAIGFRE